MEDSQDARVLKLLEESGSKLLTEKSADSSLEIDEEALLESLQEFSDDEQPIEEIKDMSDHEDDVLLALQDQKSEFFESLEGRSEPDMEFDENDFDLTPLSGAPPTEQTPVFDKQACESSRVSSSVQSGVMNDLEDVIDTLYDHN